MFHIEWRASGISMNTSAKIAAISPIHTNMASITPTAVYIPRIMFFIMDSFMDLAIGITSLANFVLQQSLPYFHKLQIEH